MSVNKCGIFKYLKTVSRAAHRHSDLSKMTTGGRLLRAQAYEVRNGGNHIMFPITNNVLLPILLAYFCIACWMWREINVGVRKKGSGKKCRHNWMWTWEVERSQDRVQLWALVLVLAALRFLYHKICYLKKGSQGKRTWRKVAGCASGSRLIAGFFFFVLLYV